MLSGGTLTVESTYAITGTMAVSDGTHTFTATTGAASVESLMLSGGAVDFAGSVRVDIGTHTQTGGALGGNVVVNVSGMMTWSGGSIGGAGVLNANGGMQINNAGTVELTGTRRINNAGAATWMGAGNVSNSPETVFTNQPPATFTISSTGEFLG